METITKTYSVYSFNELSEEAKQTALDNFEPSTEFIFDDAGESLRKFIDIFSIKNWSIDFLEPYRNSYKIDIDYYYNEQILELSGIRLMKYILNNYSEYLFARKYIKHGELRDVKPNKFHRMRKVNEITSNCSNKGKFRVAYYSNINFDNSCVLTGMCYDDSLLKPIYDYLLKPSDRVNFEDLIGMCIDSLSKDVESEYCYRHSDEGKIEDIEANGYKFTEDGEIF